MKIGISYINANNYGDQIIYFTAKYLLEKSLKNNGILDYELVPIDICLADRRGMNVAVASEEADAAKKAAEERIQAIEEKMESTKDLEELKRLAIEKWHESEIYKDFLAHEAQKLEDIDFLYVSGGGLIKFHQQHYHMMIHEMTAKCDERNIPMIISGVGVEGYTEGNPDCMVLKEALNRKCLRYISVRDDLETLRKYIVRDDLLNERVADPAFWTREHYEVGENDTQQGLVGLNVIRAPIWALYDYPVDTVKLMEVYADLIRKLIENGYTVEIFANGVRGDWKFVTDMLEKYSELKGYIQDERLLTFDPPQPRDLVVRISEYERYMAVRLHSAIVGTVLGVPNISLVWNRKQPLFGQQTGTEENFIIPADFTADNIYEHLINAEPWPMDEEYKNSVYKGIDDQIRLFAEEYKSE